MDLRGKTMSKSSSKEGKIERAVKMLPKSSLVMRVMPKSQGEWAGILSELDEKKVDDLLMLLEQEGHVFVGGRDEHEWQEGIDKAEYIERLEDLRISMERVTDNPSGDA